MCDIDISLRSGGGWTPSIFWVGAPKYYILINVRLKRDLPCPLATPKLYICINFDRKGIEVVNLWFPQIHILLWKGEPLCDHQKSYFCNAYLAHKIQNFLRQGGAAPCNPQNYIYIYIYIYIYKFWQKRTEIVHLWFPKYTFSNEKEGCPHATTKNHIFL